MEDKLMSMGMNSTVNANLLRSYDTGQMFSYVSYPWFSNRSTFEEAFKVATMLLENDWVKEMSLKKFITLIKEIEKQL